MKKITIDENTLKESKEILEDLIVAAHNDAKQKINLIHHLNRKNKCEQIEEFISIEEVKKYYGLDDNPKEPQTTHFEPKINPKAPIIEDNEIQNESSKTLNSNFSIRLL